MVQLSEDKSIFFLFFSYICMNSIEASYSHKQETQICPPLIVSNFP